MARSHDVDPSSDAMNGPVSFVNVRQGLRYQVSGDSPVLSLKAAPVIVPNPRFNGRETSTGSCLAFAPRSKTGSNNQATEADWQAQTKDDFVQLEPWAVPCGNQWMKDHWDKWQGYSFYSVDTSIEKCLTVTFALNMQPVAAFVGGIEFDLLPGPLAEIDTQVCWPRHQPGGLDLSVLRSVIRSNGVLLFSRTLRLSKRFGDDTHFVTENVHGGHQTSRSFFGTSATDEESGTGMASMKRSSLLESNQSRAQAKARLQESLRWETDEEDLYLASVEYGEDMGEMGMNKTSEMRGSSARKRISSLLQSTSQNKWTSDSFKLFEFKNPGLVNFEIRGLLSSNWLQLGLQMGFGAAYQSPEMTIPLVNLAAQFVLILDSMPDELVSKESRARAIAALTDFSISDIGEVMSNSKVANVAEDVAGGWSFSVNSPPVGSGITREASEERPPEVLSVCQGEMAEGSSCSDLPEADCNGHYVMVAEGSMQCSWMDGRCLSMGSQCRITTTTTSTTTTTTGLFHTELEPAAPSSMVAWFKSEDAHPVWKSAVGSWQGRVTKGSIARKVEAGSGATRPVTYLRGLSNAGYDFGKIMKPDFTICSITRYLEGGIMGRILQNNNPNFLHGHHAGHAGVAYYGTWVTPHDVPGNTDWLVMCGNNRGVVFVGNGRSNIAVRHGALQNAADFNLYINEGQTSEPSDFGVMEVITWDRALSEDEMWTSMEYLNWKLQETLPHHPAAQSSMVAWFKSEDAHPVWKSAVGSWQGRVTKGSIARKVEAGNGATRPVAYLAGDSNAAYDFGKIMKPNFTICSITRYVEGGRMERILQNSNPNVFHGHHHGRTGVAYYGAWVTFNHFSSNTDWLVMCGNNEGVVYVGNDQKDIGIRHGVLHNADFNLYINENTGEASDFGVMEVITWDRALSEDEMWTSMEYLNWKLQAHLAHRPSAESSMVAWFKSEDANPVWQSAVGSWQGRLTNGSVLRKFSAGNGAPVPVAYLAGDSNAVYDFGKIMKPDFTICSITRYLEGGIMGRILQNNNPNFLHGHHAGHAGVAYYGTWVTPHDVPGNTDWLVMCGNNHGVVFVGNGRSNIAVRHGALQNAADFNLYINEGQTSEPSDFGVMEVITWDRALSEDEMWTSMEYLNWKLQATIPREPADKRSMVAWFKSEDATPAWQSAVGSWQGRVTKGSIARKVEAGNGATRPVTYLRGLSNAGYDFGKIMKMDFTICSITRYLEGGVMGRILQNNNPNFLHGHHAGHTGVAYYGTWVTPHDVPGNTDWLVMCGNNKGVVFVGNKKSNIAVHYGALRNTDDFNLYINEGFTDEVSDFGVMEVITWRRALSEDEMWTSMEYLNWKLQETLPHHPAAPSSMVAWFKSEDATPAWQSAVGSWQGRVTKGSIARKVEAGSGATRPVTYLRGLSNAGYDFGKIMKPDFTICSITRYLEGGAMGRILQNRHPNFIHGHHGGRTGLAYYGTWVTPQDVPGNTDWLVMCGNNQGVVFVGNGRSNIAVRHGALQNAADFNLYINEGQTSEPSDFGVMEVITWNRALSEDEMWTSMEYLNWKLVKGSQ